MNATRVGLIILLSHVGAAHATPVPEMAKKFIKEGLALYEADKYEESREAFGRAQVIAPDHEKLFYYIGVCESLMGNCAGAVKNLGEYLRRAPDGSYAVDATGRRDLCLMVMGKKPEPVPPAVKLPEPAPAIAPATEMVAPRVTAVAPARPAIKIEKVHILDEDEEDLARPRPPKPEVAPLVMMPPAAGAAPLAPARDTARNRRWKIGLGVGAALAVAAGAATFGAYIGTRDPLGSADIVYNLANPAALRAYRIGLVFGGRF